MVADPKQCFQMRQNINRADIKVARDFPSRDLGRPIVVVFLGGAFLEPAALQFLVRLDADPEIELVGGFCQSRGFDLYHRAADVLRRRKFLGIGVLGLYAARAARRFLTCPRTEWKLRQRARRALTRLTVVADIHAPLVLEQMRALAPDLGIVYGSPILKPQLFQIPAMGTLGIHHGKPPEYRGKKTAFWACLNGEASAGVTIQRINAGVDTGDVVCGAEVPIAGKRYGRVEAALQNVGVELYVSAIVAVKRGEAVSRPQTNPETGRLYREPRARDVLRLWRRQLTGDLRRLARAGKQKVRAPLWSAAQRITLERHRLRKTLMRTEPNLRAATERAELAEKK
jgi:methionyl-tRNA formyltransferase